MTTMSRAPVRRLVTGVLLAAGLYLPSTAGAQNLGEQQEASEPDTARSAPPPGLERPHQEPQPTWDRDDPYLNSLVDPFRPRAQDDRRFGRDENSSEPRPDPSF